MSLSLLQMRLKKNEEDFARLNSISFDDEVKDVKKKMPGENNPWSGELKARRKESRTAEAEGTKNTKKTKSPVELKSESKDKVKLLNTSKLSSDSLHTPSKLLDTNQTDTNHNDTATKDSIEDTVADTNTLTNTNLDKTEIHRDVLTNTNIKPRKYENKNLLDKKLKPSQEEQEEESNANKFEVYSPEETNSNETVNNSVAVNDHKQGTGDEDSEILKITRRNLKPVLQPFKRSESITDDVQTETPVERLIRQGSLEATSEQPKARPSTNNQTRTMQDLSEKIDEQQVREEEKLKKKSEEYLMVNFPAGVRKNLKGIILPEKDEELGERVTNTDSEDEGKGSLGRAGVT